MLGSCSVRFLASRRIFDETSIPTTSLAALARCWKRRPVPQPTSRMSSFCLSLMLSKATSILAFCSS